jgi:hypothetical protein
VFLPKKLSGAAAAFVLFQRFDTYPEKKKKKPHHDSGVLSSLFRFIKYSHSQYTIMPIAIKD